MIRPALASVVVILCIAARSAAAAPTSYVSWDVHDICVGRFELRNIDGTVRLGIAETSGGGRTGRELVVEIRSADLFMYAPNQRLDHEANGVCNARPARKLLSAHVVNGRLSGQRITRGGDVDRLLIDAAEMPLTANSGDLRLFGGQLKVAAGTLRVHDRVSVDAVDFKGSFDLASDSASATNVIYGFPTDSAPSVVTTSLKSVSNGVQFNILGSDGTVAFTSGVLGAAKIKRATGAFTFKSLKATFTSGIEPNVTVHGSEDSVTVQSEGLSLMNATVDYEHDISATAKAKKIAISKITSRLPQRTGSLVLKAASIEEASASAAPIVVTNANNAIALQGDADFAFSMTTKGRILGRATLTRPRLPLMPTSQSSDSVMSVAFREFGLDQSGPTFEAQVALAELNFGRVVVSDPKTTIEVHYHGGPDAILKWISSATAVTVYADTARTTKQYIGANATLAIEATLNLAAPWTIAVAPRKLDAKLAKLDSVAPTLLGGRVSFSTPGATSRGIHVYNLTPLTIASTGDGDFALEVQALRVQDGTLTLAPGAAPVTVAAFDSHGAVVVRLNVSGTEQLESGVLEADHLQLGKLVWEAAHSKMVLDSLSVEAITLNATAGVVDCEMRTIAAPGGEFSRDAAPRFEEVVLQSPGLRIASARSTMSVSDGSMDLTGVTLTSGSFSAKSLRYTDEAGLQVSGLGGTFEFAHASQKDIDAQMKLEHGSAHFSSATANGTAAVDRLTLSLAGTFPKVNGSGKIAFRAMQFQGDVGVHVMPEHCGENLMWLALRIDADATSGDVNVADGKIALALPIPKTYAQFSIAKPFQCEWDEPRHWEAKKLHFTYPCPTWKNPLRTCQGWTYITPEINFSIRWILRVFSAGGRGWFSEVTINTGGDKGFKLCGGHMRDFAPTTLTLFHLNWTLPNSNIITSVIREFVNALAAGVESTLANNVLGIGSLLSQFGIGEHMNIFGSCYK